MTHPRNYNFYLIAFSSSSPAERWIIRLGPLDTVVGFAPSRWACVRKVMRLCRAQA